MVTITKAIACVATIFINTSGFEWNNHDQKILKRAEYVCSKDSRYVTDTPCVKTLTKTEERVYRVICGYGAN